MTDSTENVRQNYHYGFFVDFSYRYFSKTAENPFIEPLKD